MNSDIFYSQSFDYFLNKLENNEHFRYSRFNDGELIAIIGNQPQKTNCDGHIYFPEMGKKLKDVLLNYKWNTNYILESFDHWYVRLPRIRNILLELKKENSELKFLNNDFIRISHEQKPIDFNKILDFLSNKKMVIIGPYYLSYLKKHFSFRHIDVPIKNCFLEIDRIINEMKNISDKESDVYFLLSASMPTNIIIDVFDDEKNTYLDWGSVWDTFFVSPKFSFIRKRSTSSGLENNKEYKKYLI